MTKLDVSNYSCFLFLMFQSSCKFGTWRYIMPMCDTSVYVLLLQIRDGQSVTPGAGQFLWPQPLSTHMMSQFCHVVQDSQSNQCVTHTRLESDLKAMQCSSNSRADMTVTSQSLTVLCRSLAPVLVWFSSDRYNNNMPILSISVTLLHHCCCQILSTKVTLLHHCCCQNQIGARDHDG